jgi:hypothetical protein
MCSNRLGGEGNPKADVNGSRIWSLGSASLSFSTYSIVNATSVCSLGRRECRGHPNDYIFRECEWNESMTPTFPVSGLGPFLQRHRMHSSQLPTPNTPTRVNPEVL